MAATKTSKATTAKSDAEFARRQRAALVRMALRKLGKKRVREVLQGEEVAVTIPAGKIVVRLKFPKPSRGNAERKPCCVKTETKYDDGTVVYSMKGTCC